MITSLKRSGALLILVANFSILSTNSHSAEWREFRGSSQNGILEVKTTPAPITSADQILWKASLPGRGLSSPIRVGDGVFVTTGEGSRQNELAVWRFDNATGDVVWKRRFWATGRTMTHPKTSVAASTPASDGERIVALFSCNDLICLDLNGNVQWIRGLTQDYPNASNSLGMSSSTIFVDGVVIIQIENDSQSLAIGVDPKTGKNLWILDRPKAANWTSPIRVPKPDGSGHWVALQSNKGLDLVEPATGSLRWQYKDGASGIPSSIWNEGAIYAPSYGITAIQIPEDASKTDLEIAWNASRLQPATASPLIVGDHIFTLNNAGVLSCGEVESGDRLWQLRLKGPFSGSPVAAGSIGYFANESGLVQSVQFNGDEEATIVGTLDLEETILCTPALSEDALYLRSDSTLWKIGIGNR